MEYKHRRTYASRQWKACNPALHASLLIMVAISLSSGRLGERPREEAQILPVPGLIVKAKMIVLAGRFTQLGTQVNQSSLTRRDLMKAAEFQSLLKCQRL